MKTALEISTDFFLQILLFINQATRFKRINLILQQNQNSTIAYPDFFFNVHRIAFELIEEKYNLSRLIAEYAHTKLNRYSVQRGTN
jgi:hypothetical protein